MDQLIDGEARDGAGRQDPRRGAQAARAAGGDRRRRAAGDRRLRPERCRHRQPDSRPRRSGACASSRCRWTTVYRHLDTHVLFKLHWGGRGVKGEAWTRLVRDDFQPRLERMWREQTYLHPRALLGLLPVQLRRQRADRVGSRGLRSRPPRELERLVFPRQPRHDRICLADFYRPLGSGELDVVALQAVTAGDEVTELMAQARGRRRVRRAAVRARPRRPDRRGDGRVAARARPRRPRASSPRRAAATRGATPPARSSPSTRRCSGCSTRRRSACACRAASRSSPSSRRSRSSPTTRRRSTSG